MSTVRKYTALPDLDPAPDIYETPELTDDTSTHPTSTYRSDSPEHDHDDEENNRIDRHRIDPDEARTHFLSSAERESHSSSRVNGKRKSYRSSSRKRRKDRLEINCLINGIEISSDEEDESLDRKLARLQREVSELKEEYSQNDSRKGRAAQDAKDGVGSLDTLSQVLDSIAPSAAAGEDRAATRLAKRLETTTIAKGTTANGSESREDESQYIVSYAPNYQEDHTLAKISDFDSRLALLESVLGIDSIPLPTQESTPTKAILPSLDTLDKQLTTLSTSSESSLDAISRKVRQLSQDAEKLEQARKAAKAAHEALRQEALNSPGNNNTSRVAELSKDISNVSNDIEDPESISKINALYGTLSTIESIAPTLPLVLDRLRSLRSLHADAASASQTLTKVETRQEEMQEEIRGWREGLEKVEKAMGEGEETMKVNTEMVDGWVKDLEGRMRKLGE
ncbi:hypothetical protein ACLMJK_006735 [Lecanora helva]